MYSYEGIFQNKKKVLFVTAHPDDVDFYFAGTICRLAQDNKEVLVLLTTNGGRGSGGRLVEEIELGNQRIEEEKNALKVLGLPEDSLLSLNYLDGEVENNLEVVGKIARILRQFTPDIVCTHEPKSYYHSSNRKGFFYVNHRDHRHTGLSVLDAVYPFARDKSFFKEHMEEGINPHTLQEVLFTGDEMVNTKIDISKVLEQKKNALLCHQSQFDKESVEEIMEMFKEDDGFYETANYIRLAW